MRHFAAVGVLAAVGHAFAAPIPVNDPGFEAGGSFPNIFLEWTEFPPVTASIVQDFDNARSGGAAAKLFGQYNGGENASFLTQIVPATPGEVWDFSAWAKHISDDPIEGFSLAFIQLSFLDGDDDAIEFTNNNILGSDSPTDVYTQYNVLAVAPEGTTQAQMLVGYVQVDFFENGSVFFDDVALETLGPPTGPANPSFETVNANGSEFLPGWTPYDPAAPNIQQNNAFPRTGVFSALIFGQFNGVLNDSVLYQDIEATAGDTVDASVWAAHVGFDALQGGNFAFLNIEFLDAGGELISFVTEVALTESDPTDLHIQTMVSGVAPAGTASARVVLGFQQPADGVGAVHFDDVEVTITPGASCEGDLNGDNMVNSSDLNVLLASFGEAGGPSDGDISGDGQVNSTDLNLLLAAFGDVCG